jgi:hypothetical protein
LLEETGLSALTLPVFSESVASALAAVPPLINISAKTTAIIFDIKLFFIVLFSYYSSVIFILSEWDLPLLFAKDFYFYTTALIALSQGNVL